MGLQINMRSLCSENAMSDPSRQYYPIWKQLKLDHEVRVAVPRPLHARVIKAVTKEKWMDIEYKYQLMELQDCRSELVTLVSNNIITFRLEIRKINRFGSKIPIKLSDLV